MRSLDDIYNELDSLHLRRVQAQLMHDWRAVQIITQRCVRIRYELNERFGG